MRLILASILVCFATVVHAANVSDLQDISVTIKAESAQGSGVLFTRDGTTFVWTAGHVVKGLRHVRPIISDGVTKTVIEFKDAEVVQEFTENGRRVGEIKLDAKVIKYSEGEDLAILEIRKKNLAPVTAHFYLDAEIPPIGTELLHVGSLLGQFGANSLTTGIVSKIGRTLDTGNGDVIFDQTTVTAFPGSSGGGVFLKSDQRYVGMVVRGAGEQFNFIVPVRRIKEWATKVDVLWAIDQNVALPEDEERAKITIEE